MSRSMIYRFMTTSLCLHVFAAASVDQVRPSPPVAEPTMNIGENDKRRRDASQEKISLADLTEILLAPDYIFGKTPHRVGAAIDMLPKAGILKSKPPSWKDMYFAEAHALPGD